MNRQPNLSDGSAGFLLDAESTLNLTPRLRCPIFDFVYLHRSGGRPPRVYSFQI